MFGACLLLSVPAAAQVRLGEFTASATGTIAPGYSATYSNLEGSSHSWLIGGNADFSGAFYNPNFLSYNVGVYLNQSRANSNFQSISNASGVDASTTVFGGSHFPGSINYSKAYNSEGNYALPGVADYVTHGNSDTFGITWSENLPDKPSLSAGYQMGSSNYSVYGTTDQGENHFHSFNLHSSYRLAGYTMGAYYSSGGSNSVIPRVVAGELSPESHASDDSYGFNVSHALPFQGSASGGFNRSSWKSSYLGFTTDGSVDLLNAVATVHPKPRLSLTGSANYSDNLSGQIIQSIVSAGGAVAEADAHQNSNSLDVMGVASYSPMENLQAYLSAERRSQTYLGETYAVNSYGGGASYSRALLNGNFSSSFNITDNNDAKNDQNALGFSATENYTSVVLGWHVSGAFGYAQNVQTLLVTYMNSYYNYSGSAHRKWGKLNFSAAAAGAHTALTDQPGTTNSSETYDGTIGYGAWITAAGSYSKANGEALITGAGFVPVPVPPPVVPSSLVNFYGGHSYSFSASSTPVKRLVLSAAYARANSNTSSETIQSANQNEQFNALVQYQYRKLQFTSGFARLEQGFSGSGVPAEIVSSYFIGASRWFKFF